MISKQKKEGQYMTPTKIVDIILDDIGFVGDNVLEKTIIEPSFGNGVFLLNIVKRIILEGKKRNKSNDEISFIINHNVYGIEKDKNLYNETIKNLNILLSKYNLININWKNLINGDTLIEYKKHIGTKDFVVGNPPFVRIHNLDEEYKTIIKNFKFTKGAIDLYIIFYEIGLLMLNNSGKLGYISPNTFMKNNSQKDFRNYLINEKLLLAIYDFKTSKIFNNANTYTCICLLDKGKKEDNYNILYQEYFMYEKLIQTHFEYTYFLNNLINKTWNLSSKENVNFLEQNKKLKIKIDNIAIIQNGIVTNRDSVYILKVFEDEKLTIPYLGKHSDINKIVYFNKENIIYKIESSILHRCVKESTFCGNIDNTYIIYPYIQEPNKKYEPMTENFLKTKYPNAYIYLLDKKNELLTRNMDKKSLWFLFGRSQGLLNINNKKIVFKHIINKDNPQIIPYILDEDIIVYSGFYVTIPTETSNISLDILSKIFSSYDFSRYCCIVGKDMSSGYIWISSKIIKNFGIQ